jgi:hypothetical protein
MIQKEGSPMACVIERKGAKRERQRRRVLASPFK